MATPRWEGDEIGSGVGDAGEFMPSVRELLDVMALPDWVTEDPHVHLRPRLSETVEAPGSPWRLVDEEVVLAVYQLTLEWRRPDATLADLRSDVFALLGPVTAAASHVRERLVADRVEYEVVTGTLEGEGPFRPHGHMLRLRVVGKDARRVSL